MPNKEQPTVIRIAVGSANPCKIEAVRSAFESTFQRRREGEEGNSVHIVITSHSVPSGVSDQPHGDEETRKGARNRAKAAWDDAVKDAEEEGDAEKKPDFAVGLEGGVEELRSKGERDDEDGNSLWCMAWMAIIGSGNKKCTMAMSVDSTYVPKEEGNNNGGITTACAGGKFVWGYGRTGSFLLPPEITKLVHGGMELGDADDAVFRRVNSKHGGGTVGVLTDGMIDRSGYYDHALKLALVPWIRPELYIYNK
mmetsp:Transcript_10726/g.16029  ORF Transcript_10726/g.16029 Transcript_10726/m.16029 type:complete len:253 (-) Transcript_10726:27-785(-)